MNSDTGSAPHNYGDLLICRCNPGNMLWGRPYTCSTPASKAVVPRCLMALRARRACASRAAVVMVAQHLVRDHLVPAQLPRSSSSAGPHRLMRARRLRHFVRQGCAHQAHRWRQRQQHILLMHAAATVVHAAAVALCAGTTVLLCDLSQDEAVGPERTSDDYAKHRSLWVAVGVELGSARVQACATGSPHRSHACAAHREASLQAHGCAAGRCACRDSNVHNDQGVEHASDHDASQDHSSNDIAMERVGHHLHCPKRHVHTRAHSSAWPSS